MSILADKRRKIEEKIKSHSEGSLLELAEELVRFKDEKGTNLFWSDEEEEMLRQYIDVSIKFSSN